MIAWMLSEHNFSGSVARHQALTLEAFLMQQDGCVPAYSWSASRQVLDKPIQVDLQ